MKIGIVTYHFVNNFGAALQTYGLSRTLLKVDNVEVNVVDYRHWFIRFTDFIRVFPITTNFKEIISGIKTFSERRERLEKFSKFHNEKFSLTEKYLSVSSIEKNPPNCDKFVCGSDQIWNPIITRGVSSPYYLDFAEKKEQRVSYAASFGVSDVNKKYYSKMEEYFKNFKAISVREKEGINLVKEISVFLLTKEEWLELSVEYKIDYKYILVYIMQNNDSVYEHAKKIKDALGLKIISISRYGYAPDFVDETLVNVGPKEFLGLFKNAEYICTNSFHGLAFSIIFEKEFSVIPSKRFNSRLQNLIDLFGIESLNEFSIDEIHREKYDKKNAEKIIQNERKKSLEFLNKNLIN
jgi:hypothetical protein